jgi:CheY-like chemotaxis protein
VLAQEAVLEFIGTAPPTGTTHSLKIRGAEDNLPNRELIREILENSGYEVIEANDGQQALERLGAGTNS